MANIIDNLDILNTNLDNAKFKIAKNLKDKGVQALPSDKLDTLADKIVDIPSGSCNLQELNVVENGVYTPQAGDVKGYNKVTVNVPTGGGNEPYKFSEIGYTGNEEPLKSDLAYSKKIYDEWDASQTNLTHKFFSNKQLVYMPLVDTSNATNMYGMFGYCKSLTSIPQLDTSKVTNMLDMFLYCLLLKSIPLLDTSNVTNMGDMFGNCQSLTSIPQLDTSKVTSMHSMFDYCSLLTSIPQLNTSNVTDMQYMFNQCHKLQSVPEFNTSKVTNMQYMFSGCQKLTSIPQLDTSNVTNMSWMFGNCSLLTSIPQLNTSNVTDMNGIFYGCKNLRYINIIGLGTKSEITKLELYGDQWSKNINIGVDGDGITGCRQVLVDSLLTNSFNRATAGYPICDITLAQETKNLLTQEEISAIEAKGYTLTVI